MQPKIHAYLAIEDTANRTLRAAFEPAGEALVQSVAQHLKHGDKSSALAEITRFDHTGQVKKTRAKLTELGVSALLYGASRLKPIKETVFAKTLPRHELDNAITQALTIAGDTARHRVIADARRLLRTPTPEERHALIRKSGLSCCPHESSFVCKAEADDYAYPDISDAMNDVVMGTGRALTHTAGNLTMSRLASFGFLSQAWHDGVQRYQISAVLDSRTCPVCMFMDGKSFDVEPAFSRLRTALSTDDPNDLKALAPWPRQDKASLAEFLSRDASELQRLGFDLPSFHPGCRCVLVPVGTVSETMVPVSQDTPPSIVEQGIAAMRAGAGAELKAKGTKSFFEWLDGMFGNHDGTQPDPYPDPAGEDGADPG